MSAEPNMAQAKTAAPIRLYEVAVRRDRQIFTETVRRADVAAYTVTCDGLPADVSGLLWIEATYPGRPTITSVVQTADYRSHSIAMAMAVEP